MSPGCRLSSARATRINKPSAAMRFRASILVIEELELIDGIEQNAISIELRTDPSLQAFHLENRSLGGYVVVHRKKRVSPPRKPLFVLFCTDGKIAMAVFGRSPDCAHFRAVHKVFVKRASPILISNRSGIHFAGGYRV